MYQIRETIATAWVARALVLVLVGIGTAFLVLVEGGVLGGIVGRSVGESIIRRYMPRTRRREQTEALIALESAF